MLQIINSDPFDFDLLMNYINQQQPEIVIFGADIAGKVTAQILKSKNIPVAFFVDNNKNKCDGFIDGVRVEYAKNLTHNGSKRLFLIASTYISDIVNQLESIGVSNWAPIVGFLEHAMMGNVRDILNGDLRKNHAGGEFTRDFDEFVLKNMINSQRKYLDPEKLYIRSIDLIITERCSLKCKDCSNLMQYYERPQNIEIDVLREELDTICEIADEINEIRVIGGDPFMNKSFAEITSYAAGKANVNSVVVYTNGSICPPPEKISLIANKKTFVFITTYGDHSRNVGKLEKLLIECGVNFNTQPAYGWTDCGTINQHFRSDSEQEKIFGMCCAKHFTTLTMGKLFRCPFTANAFRLSAIPDDNRDYISLADLSDSSLSKTEIRAKLKKFLRNIPFTPACDFCNGRTYGDPEIVPGIQTEKPIIFKKFI
ncbi:radical SAM protein [Chromobacterium amazonense]|uniref:Radical SAM protein n=1 Tax=Chromobacterium amazonense TaxID=1382803 RepID=A0ABU8V3T8_9NEIS|nr:radical SAM protein [Chromobacterium amazonense]MDQ4538984.1 radical SAM protein [Chromobacterium amazonense]